MSYLEQERPLVQQPTFYLGDAVRILPEEVRRSYALKVSEELTTHPHTMLQFTPDEILESIDKGRAVLAIGENNELIGFAQLRQYGLTKSGKRIIEFGSWLSFPKGQGLGEKILKKGITLGKQIYPEAQIVALVEENNIWPQDIIRRSGGIEIDSRHQPAIRTKDDEAAFMKIFDITDV